MPRPRPEPAVREQTRRRGPTVRRWLTLGLAVTLLLGLAAVAPSHVRIASALYSAAGATSFQLTTEQSFSFTPNEIQNLATSTNVTVQLTNGDLSGTNHTFTISSVQGTVIPESADIGSFFKLHPPLFSIGSPSAGGTLTQSFPAPPKGWYEFICNVSGHFQKGMYGFIAFGENLPTNLTVSAAMTGPGAAVFIITGTIVALVVIALVLGFVIGRRRGAVHEMPPERLGYPEPELPPAPGPNPPNPSLPKQ